MTEEQAAEQMKTLYLLILAVFACPHSLCDGAVEVHVGSLWKITAYCPCKKCCGKWADGVTASGHKIKRGDRFVAAPKELPFGTEVIIQGYNNREAVSVLDRGGAIKGKRLDVFFDTHEQALAWGVKWLRLVDGDKDVGYVYQ